MPLPVRYFTVFRLPSTVADGDLRLRPIGLLDVPSVSRALERTEIWKTCGPNKGPSLPWLSNWWWLKKTFTPAYGIEIGSGGFIGLIGMYDRGDGSLCITLVIWDRQMRRLGYGTRAFHLFIKMFSRLAPAEKIFVSVHNNNDASLLFWKKLGFSYCQGFNETTLLSADLRSICRQH